MHAYDRVCTHAQDKPKEIRVGIELDDARVDVGSSQKGKLDGTHGGERYFTGKPKHCVMVLPKKVRSVEADGSTSTAAKPGSKLQRRSSLNHAEVSQAEDIKAAAVLAEMSKRKGFVQKEPAGDNAAPENTSGTRRYC